MVEMMVLENNTWDLILCVENHLYTRLSINIYWVNKYGSPGVFKILYAD